jgi:peptidoglycan/LPS O-acetylase OafA/YrhL
VDLKCHTGIILVRFRKDIQGLRAIAVILVFLFHADSSRFSIGYLGVDIFICISGFVIIQVLEKNSHFNTQVILNFLTKRMRRIYPLLLFFLAIQLALSLIFQPVLPNLKFTFLSVLGLGNFYFARSSTDYWNNFSETPWNLHTWSIALELQFYLTLACIVFLVQNYRVRMYLIIFMLSLSLIFYYHSKSSGLYPYLIHERFWEFSIGVLAYYSSKWKINKSLKRSLPILYFVFLTFIFIFIDDVRLIAVLLCYTILVFPKFVPDLILENRFVLFLGLISFSFFMWHYPLVRILNLYFAPSLLLISIEFVLSLGLSFLSYKFIENHFRNPHSFRINQIIAFGVLFAVLIFNYSSTYERTQIHTTTIENPSRCIEADEKNGIPGFYSDCFVRDAKIANTLILGDSYAQLLGSSLFEEFSSRGLGYSVISTGSCALEDANGCRPQLKSEIISLKVKQIILTSNWAGNLFPRIPIFPYKDVSSCQDFKDTQENCPRFDRDLRSQINGLMQLIEFFRKQGVEQVTVIGQSPEFPFDPKSCVRLQSWQKIFASNQTIHLCNENYYDFVQHRSAALNDVFAIQSTIRQNFDFIDPTNSLCPKATCRVTDSDGVPLYADSVHLSPRGLQILVRDLKPLIFP